MGSDLLSLKWNNHSSTFFHLLLKVCLKESHSDATIACQGRYFPAHRLVLSSCSKYFEEIFENCKGKHPFIIINDLAPEEFEALMKYMYMGEVYVPQNKLPALIKAAEALCIKGLAIPDEIPNCDLNKKSRAVNDHSSSSKRRRLSSEFSKEQEAAYETNLDNISRERETTEYSHLPQPNVSSSNSSSSIINENPVERPLEMVNIKSEPMDLKPCISSIQEGVDGSIPHPPDLQAEALPFIESTNDPLQLTSRSEVQFDCPDQNVVLPPNISYSSLCEMTRSDPAVVNGRKEFEASGDQLLGGIRRSFRCHYCSYISFNRTHTINHMRRHTGEKPFSCALCFKRFSLKHNLDRHRKSHKH